MNGKLLSETYNQVRENQFASRSWELTIDQLPLKGMFIVKSPSTPRAYQIWVDNKKVVKATTTIKGGQIDLTRLNTALFAGETLGEALTHATVFTTDLDNVGVDSLLTQPNMNKFPSSIQ